MNRLNFRSFIPITFILICMLCSCSNLNKPIVVSDSSHPVCNSVFSNVENTEDPAFEIDCDGNNYIMFSNQGDKLYLYTYNQEQICTSEICTVNNIAFSYISFTSASNNTFWALAVNEDNSTCIVQFENGEMRSFQDVDADMNYSKILSTESGFFIAGDNGLQVYDRNLNLVSDYHSNGVILGAVSHDDFIYVSEVRAEAICLSKLDIRDCSVKEEYELEFVNPQKYRHYGDVSLYIGDESEAYLSTADSVTNINLAKRTASTRVNVYDFGVEYSPQIIYADTDKIVALVSYYDVIQNRDVNCLAEFMNESESQQNKTVINAVILTQSNYDKYFQYINRTNADFYVSINRYQDELNSASYAELISSDDIDMFVFDDLLKDDLLKGEYLLNLNELGIESPLDYYDYYEYSLKMYFYNSELWNGNNSISELIADNSFVELFANQDISMMAEEYSNIFYEEYRETGDISMTTISDYLTLCSTYDSSYFENRSFINELRGGSFIFLNSQINSIEELYSVFCYYGGNIGVSGPLGYEAPVIVPNCYLGISSNTQNQEACVSILEDFDSVEFQRSFDFPSNLDCFREKLDDFINTLDNEKANEILLSYPLYSDAGLEALSSHYDAITQAMLNGTHTEEMDENFDLLSTNLRPIVDDAGLEDFRELVVASIQSEEGAPSCDPELLQILIEETAADSENAEDVLHNRLILYSEENWA